MNFTSYQGRSEGSGSPREHMFDKVVTSSDLGKLNRLVIPKQHAEKYFALDPSSSDKGLLLNFEDRNGKPSRFRYFYWISSQSYVMTKGWSRFVKEVKTPTELRCWNPISCISGDPLFSARLKYGKERVINL